jgi:hypothetical protein
MQLGLKDYEYNPQIVKLDEPSEASLIVFIGHSSLKKSPFTSFFSSIDTNIP